jgi:hypothetical protein
VDSLAIYPSENPIAVSQTLRGGLILPKNVVEARPNPRVAGFTRAGATPPVHVAGSGTGAVGVKVVNANLIPKQDLFKIGFTTPSPDSLRATRYYLVDSTTSTVLFQNGTEFNGRDIGPVGGGLLPLVSNPLIVTVDSTRTGWDPGSATTERFKVTYNYDAFLPPINQLRPGFPDDITITFDNVVRDTGLDLFPISPAPAKFKIVAHTAQGDLPLDFRFEDDAPQDGTLSLASEFIDIVTYVPAEPGVPKVTWHIELDGPPGAVKPKLGDVWELRLKHPLGAGDVYTFTASGSRVDGAKAQVEAKQEPYVVPNPYIGSASFEPAPFAISGRGERRIEFRAVPQNCTIRIYTVHGDLVRTLRQNGSNEGFVAWDVRTKDNLDLAPGLYIFQVEAPGTPTHTGKFAVIK